MSITIKEFDNTKAGSANYTNFSVVVPGYCAPGKGLTCFDENGIYECSSQSEFYENIGIVQSGGPEEPRAAVAAVASGPIADGTISVIGTKYYTKQTTTELTGYGYLKDATHTYTLAFIGNGAPVHVGSEAGSPQYYTLTNEGADEITVRRGSYGNQIAYTLLGLGYTVLYVNLGSTNTSSTPTIDDDLLEPLKDKSTYDFRYIVTGLITDSDTADDAILAVANDRKDCTALLEIKETIYKANSVVPTQSSFIDSLTADNIVSASGRYAAQFAPTITYTENSLAKIAPAQDGTAYTNRKFPAYFHYLACAKYALENQYAEWYAVAGYARGISKLVIDNATVKLGETAINSLCPRTSNGIAAAVNLIVQVKGNYYLWGNRTAVQLAVDEDLKASHFLNIRQLCTTLKKEIYIACRKFTFEPNSDVLWTNFRTSLTPTLDLMKADQGISDYKIIKLATTKKATLHAAIRIIPIEAVEDFIINVSLEDSLSGVVTFNEESEGV